MLFSYLIGTVFKLYGPVTDYWTFSINDHISYEYVITSGDECHIALGITRGDNERSISWKSLPVKDETGSDVMVNDSSGWNSGFISQDYMFTTDSSRPSSNMKVAYLMQPNHPRFSFTVDLKIESGTGEISTESTSVTCDVDRCKCREVR